MLPSSAWGLNGVSVAHYLITSKGAAELDVDIYEAQDCPGLADHTARVGAQLVSAPACMGCRGYYNCYW